MSTPRSNLTATLLSDGEVLIAGGATITTKVVYEISGLTAVTTVQPLASAELFNPESSTFVPTGSLATARTRHTATLLNSGKVLVAGGADSTGTSLSSAELYDSGTGSFGTIGSVAIASPNAAAQ
jgi:hypothetical protein